MNKHTAISQRDLNVQFVSSEDAKKMKKQRLTRNEDRGCAVGEDYFISGTILFLHPSYSRFRFLAHVVVLRESRVLRLANDKGCSEFKLN